jgi:iron complex transport system ATP-binding protein
VGAGEVIEAEGLAFAYGDRPVLRGVGLRAIAGRLLGILGPNGSGKTTLLRLLLGFLRPAAGQVRLEGRPLSEWERRAFARRVAAVPQEMPVDFPFTVTELVLLGRMPHLPPLGLEGPADLAAARDAMQACGVLELAERPIHALSGGELRRAYVARALAQQADVLLCDEPTSGLDLHHQLAVFELLRAEARAGRCVVAVVHDLNLAGAFCEEVLVLERGAAVAAGACEAVLTIERVRAVWGVEVTRLRDPGSGRTHLMPVALAVEEGADALNPAAGSTPRDAR